MTRSTHTRRALWISALLLLLAAAWLVAQWPQRSLWYDETVNAYFAGASWSAIWEWCTEIDNQVPLHFALLKLWGGVAGTSEFALRAFSAGTGLLALAGLIALGRRAGRSTIAGWLAALALAVTQAFLYAAFEVRAYGLALALFTWSSVALWELWVRYGSTPRPFDRRYARLLAFYLVLAVALVYTHYTGWLALAAQGAYVGAQTLLRPSRRRMIMLAHLGAGIVLGYLPWVLALAGRDVRAGTAYAGQIVPGQALQAYVEFYAYGQHILPPDSSPVYLIGGGLVVAAALLLAVIGLRRRPTTAPGLVYALLAAILPLAGLVLMVYAVQAKLSGRHGWPVWLGVSLLIGLGLAALARLRVARWPVWIAALVMLWLPARAPLQPIYDSQLREAFDYIAARAEPGDVLVLRDGTLFTAARYYDAAVPWAGLPPDKLTDVNRFLFFHEALDGIAALVEAHDARRVWVVAWQGHIMDPQDLVAGVLEYVGEAQPVERAFGDVFVSLYALHDRPQALYERVTALEPVAQAPPDGPAYYGGYALEDGPVTPGSLLHVQTWWKRGETVMPDVRVSVRLYGADGALYSQIDQPPAAWSFGQEHWPPGIPILSRFALWVPPETPPGPAEVRVVRYDMQGAFEPITAPLTTIEIGS